MPRDRMVHGRDGEPLIWPASAQGTAPRRRKAPGHIARLTALGWPPARIRALTAEEAERMVTTRRRYEDQAR